MSREEFQTQVLTELKRLGIVATLVYPGPQGGVFIPCDQDEVRQVAEQVIDRVIQELTNLEGITNQTQVHDIITQLREVSELARRRIQDE
jgi:DNA-binding IscR family transcriptional regulator